MTAATGSSGQLRSLKRPAFLLMPCWDGGKGNAAIAHELTISLKTVRNHGSNIFTKLRVSDRSTAIVKARQAGLGDD